MGFTKQRIYNIVLTGFSLLCESLLNENFVAGVAATETTSFSSWLEEQTRRKTLVKEVCQKSGQPALSTEQEIETILQNRGMLANLWASVRQKVIYCPLAKVACSSWRLLFMQMSGEYDFDHPELYKPHDFNLLAKYGLKRLSQYETDEVKSMLRAYPRFIITRHPYSRLHSAFTEKFTSKNGKWNPLYPPSVGAKIVKKYWKNPSEQSLKTGQNITFEDFVHYLGDNDLTMKQKVDAHWAPYYWYCFPCQVRYDYILKQETMDRDSGYLLDRVLNTTVRLSRLNNFNHTNIAAYEDIPQQYMQDLWDSYHQDFELFDYKWPLDM